MKRGIISILFAMFALCLWSAPAKATPVTIPYEFVRDESHLRLGGIWGIPTYSIEGTFSLSFDLDLGIASFDQVNVTLTPENVSYDVPYIDYPKPGTLSTNNLDVIFSMRELESIAVSDEKIDFYLDRNLPMFPDSDIRLSITFVDGSLNMTGYFSAPAVDAWAYYLNAFAVEIPEPATILILCAGGLLIRRKNL
jgi:hypothetical protein